MNLLGSQNSIILPLTAFSCAAAIAALVMHDVMESPQPIENLYCSADPDFFVNTLAAIKTTKSINFFHMLDVFVAVLINVLVLFQFFSDRFNDQINNAYAVTIFFKIYFNAYLIANMFTTHAITTAVKHLLAPTCLVLPFWIYKNIALVFWRFVLLLLDIIPICYLVSKVVRRLEHILVSRVAMPSLIRFASPDMYPLSSFRLPTYQEALRLPAILFESGLTTRPENLASDSSEPLTTFVIAATENVNDQNEINNVNENNETAESYV